MQIIKLLAPEYYMLRILKRKSIKNRVLVLPEIKSPNINKYVENLPSLKKYSKMLSWIKMLENYRLVEGKYMKKDVKYVVEKVVNFKLVEVENDIYHITVTNEDCEDVLSHHWVLEPTFAYKQIEGKTIEDLAQKFVEEIRYFVDKIIKVEVMDGLLIIVPNSYIGFELYKEYDIDREREEDESKLEELKIKINSLL